MAVTELVEGLLPEHQVSILAGASGAGKTTLLLQLVKQLQSGGPAFGMPSAASLSMPGAIGYIVADRTSQDLLETASAVGVDTAALKLRSLVDDASIDIAKFETAPRAVLFDLLSSLKSCQLVIVDPLIVFTGVDTNKYHLNAAALIRINRFCMDNGITILGTHHATKARTDFGFKRAQDRISGSSALLGYTSTQLFLSTPEENDTDYFQWTIVRTTQLHVHCAWLGTLMDLTSLKRRRPARQSR
jgi:RecA-family ATPase